MYNSTHDLLSAIQLGESSILELKEVRIESGKLVAPSHQLLADEIAAFANGKGGVLVLGVVDKTLEVVGIPLDKLELVTNRVKEACQDHITPPIDDLKLEKLMLPLDTEVCVIKLEVPRSLFVHQSPGGYLRRVADSKRKLSPESLARLFQQRSQTRLIRFDEQPVVNADLENLTEDLWRRFHTPLSTDEPETFLSKLGIVAQTGDGKIAPTVAGVLMSSANPQEWLPNAYIQAVAYRGTSITSYSSSYYQIDALDIGGPLDHQIIEACRFIIKNMRVAAIKVVGRVDKPQFDASAVFEAIVNAVAHRDYSVYGSKVRLHLFEDRLELFSPGALANSLAVDSLRYGQTVRNERLCSLLTRCPLPDEPWLTQGRRHFMEKRGEGVPIILDRSLDLSGKEPQYQIIGDAELMLTIYAATF